VEDEQSVSFGSLSVQSKKSIHHCQELENRQLSRPICVEGKTWLSGCKLSIVRKVSIIVGHLGVLNWTGSVLVATGSCIWHMVMIDYVRDANCSFGCAGSWKLTACIFSMLPVKGICAHVVCFDIRKLWPVYKEGTKQHVWGHMSPHSEQNPNVYAFTVPYHNCRVWSQGSRFVLRGIKFYCTILQSSILTSSAAISAQNNFQGLIFWRGYIYLYAPVATALFGVWKFFS